MVKYNRGEIEGVKERPDRLQKELDEETGGTRRTDGTQQAGEEREAKTTAGRQQQTADDFKNIRQNTLMRAARHLMDSASMVLRIPGTGRQIHDRRDNAEPNKEGGGKNVSRDAHSAGAAASERNLEIKEGKAREVREKVYENYLADRLMKQQLKEAPLQRSEERLSAFFEKLIERFEKAFKIEKEIENGQVRYGTKTPDEWNAFYKKFEGREAAKSADLANIYEISLRGIVKKDANKAVIIADIKHPNGIDKFSRFSVLYQKVSAALSNLVPGDAVAKQAIADGLSTEKLMYLALTSATTEAEFAVSLKPKQGIFASEATEARAAEDLGIILDKGSPDIQKDHAMKGRKKKGGGFFGWFSGDEEPAIDQSGQFMPWWQWGTLKRPGGFTLKRAFYSAVIIAVILTFLFLIDRLLLGK